MRQMTLAIALLLTSATAAMSQGADVTGQIVRIEPEHHVLVLSNGQMYRVTTGTTVLMNNQPVTLGGLRPGQSVVIRSGEPVTLQNGQYVVVSSPAVAQTPPAPAPNVIVAPPASALPAGVRQTMYGKVEDIDSDGTVKVAVDGDSFEVRLSRDMVRQLREGDRVQLDMTIVPAGTPAASPR
jgi:hypothetical protein